MDADVDDALQKVLDIQLKHYEYKRGGAAVMGYIAQQVKTVLPSAVMTKPFKVDNGGEERELIEDLNTVDKNQIFQLHHGAIQALDAKIAALKARLAALETQNSNLLSRLEALEKKVPVI